MLSHEHGQNVSPKRQRNDTVPSPEVWLNNVVVGWSAGAYGSGRVLLLLGLVTATRKKPGDGDVLVDLVPVEANAA